MANTRGIRAGAAYVELFLNDSKLVRGLNKASKKLKAFGDTITGWGKKMAAAGAAITAPLVASGQSFASMGDQMLKMTQRTGVSVETLSALTYAADVSGVSADALEGSLRRMQKTIVAAAQGSESASDALEQVGLTIDDLRGLSPDQQFKLIADRLSQIQSPAAKAALAMELFGKSGAQLLPLMADGAKGIEALQAHARALGLTMSTEDAKAAQELADTLADMWKVAKQAVFTIGSALAPAMKSAAASITQTITSAIDWIQKNKEVVLTVLKVAAAVTAAGAVVMVLGYAITTIGATLGAIGTIITTVGASIGVLGAIIAALVSPIGLAITAITALGAYLVYATGVGGQALKWLGERFNDLSSFATESFKGISDALMAGDLELAAKILWNSLQVVWRKGVLELTTIWENLKTNVMGVVDNLWYGIQYAWEIGTATITEGVTRFYYWILNVWERISTGIKNIWDETIGWVAKRIMDVWGFFDDSIDAAATKALLDSDTTQRTTERNATKDANLASIDETRAAMLAQNEQQFRQNIDAISAAWNAAPTARDAEAQKKIDAAQAELDAARKEWQAAIGQAKQKREMKDAQAPGGLKAPPDIGDYLEGLAPTIEQARQKTVSVAGTFNAMEARGLGAGPVADRIARATEQTAQNTKKLLSMQADATFD